MSDKKYICPACGRETYRDEDSIGCATKKCLLFKAEYPESIADVILALSMQRDWIAEGAAFEICPNTDKIDCSKKTENTCKGAGHDTDSYEVRKSCWLNEAAEHFPLTGKKRRSSKGLSRG